MKTLPNEPVSVYSHPYRPELALLRVALQAEGYHPTAVERIVSYVAREGTLEGAPDLDPSDDERMTWVFETGADTVPQTSPEWDEWSYHPDCGPVYQSTGGAWVADAWAHMVSECDRSAGTIAAGSLPDFPDFPREHTDAERRAFAASVAQWYREHKEG